MKKFLITAAASSALLASCSNGPDLSEINIRRQLDQAHVAMMKPASDVEFEAPNLSNMQSRVLRLQIDDGFELLGRNDQVFITREPSGSVRVTYFLGGEMIALKDGRCQRIEMSPKPCKWLKPHEWTQVFELALAFGKRNAPKF